MDSKEFAEIRHYLGKRQSDLARILCVSTKAVSSFEEGWRNIPAYVERQLLFLLSLKNLGGGKAKPCWQIKKCPSEWKENCIAWQFEGGHYCWMINGTYCQGNSQDNWEAKLVICRECQVFQGLISPIN